MLSVRDTAARVRAGLSPVTVVQDTLDRIAHLDQGLNAFCHVDSAGALTQARHIADRLAAGEDLPLAGVPVAIKDNIWVEGMPITQGSRLFEDFVAPTDARAVALLRQAGAVVVGIATCSEFACKGVTTTPLHGITRHPLNRALTPGGSSGGPAVAVASGMVPLALGTDAGGSSRRPPAHVGVVGFKPTQDAIPYGPGFAEPFWGTSVLAPITRDAEDLAFVYRLLAVAHEETKRDLRIAFTPTMGLPLPLDPAVRNACDAAISCLRNAGISITDSSPSWPAGADAAGVMPLQAAGLAQLYGDRWKARPDLFDPDLGKQIETGLALSGADVARALDASAAIRATLRTFLDDFDLILSPTSSVLAWPVDQLGPDMIDGRAAAVRDHAAFTPQFNHAGTPALSFPCGTAPNGLPVGLQIGAAAGRDWMLLRQAEHFENLFAEAGLWPAPRKARHANSSCKPQYD